MFTILQVSLLHLIRMNEINRVLQNMKRWLSHGFSCWSRETSRYKKTVNQILYCLNRKSQTTSELPVSSGSSVVPGLTAADESLQTDVTFLQFVAVGTTVFMM